MVLFKGKDKLSILERKQETKLFEYVMEEINNGKPNKGIWGQAIVKSNGDEKKAEAEYIKLRVESLKDEIALNNIIENEKLREIQQITTEKNKKEKSVEGSPFPPFNFF